MIALILGLLLLVATPVSAVTVIEIGHIDLTATFTLLQGNGTGTFDTPLTAVEVTGIFDGFVPLGATLPAGPLLAPLDWTLGSLTFHTDGYGASGADSGRYVSSRGFHVTGLDVSGYPNFLGVDWNFVAPPYNWDPWRQDDALPETGPITVHLHAYRAVVPEPATWLLLGSGVIGVGAWRRMRG